MAARSYPVRYMDTPSTPLGSHARRGYWIAMVLGILSLLYAFVLPLAGLISVSEYFLAAWGIRTRRAGAALMCAATLLLSVALYVEAMFGASTTELYTRSFASLVVLILAGLMLSAAFELWRDPSRSGAAWPWLLLPAAQVLFFVCFSPYNMPSASMRPTIIPGDCVLVNRIGARLGRPLQRDEILVFRYPLNHREDYVKRVAGVPGDRLHLLHKQLYRNGAPVNEPYVMHMSTFEDPYRDNFPAVATTPLPQPAVQMLNDSVTAGELVVPPGKYFVLGDNRDDSSDSRYWGFVDSSEIIGRPFLIYASYELTQPASTTEFRSVLNMRWNRVMKWL